MRKRDGFLLISVLLITILLLTLGLTFLSQRSLQYRRAVLFENATQARAFAESGLDDALTKFRWDLEFPPLAKDQDSFTYTEEIVADGARVGGYRVTLEGRKRFPPHCIWIIRSVGEAGSNPTRPVAQRTLQLELDVAPRLRDDTTTTLYEIFRTHPDAPNTPPNNPNYFRVIHFQDLGGL
jgi:hypothetical protein